MKNYRLKKSLWSVLVAASLPSFAQTEPASIQAKEPAASLGTVEVVGRRQSGDYQPDEVSGTKTNLPLRELPQSVRIISRQAIDDLGAVRLDETLDYVGGISRQNNFGGLWDNIAIRGLAGDENTGMAMLMNGFAGNRGFNAPRDTATIERIEFLKGPAASLYGASEPGGTLNIVTKKPKWTSSQSLETYAGSYDFKRHSLDTTGPLNQSLAYRLNVAVEDRGSFRDQVKSKRTVFAPALTLKIGSDSTLEYTGEVLRHETPLDRGIVAIKNQLGSVPINRFLGEPNDGNVRVDNQTHQFVLNQEWTNQWSSKIGLSYRQTALKGFSTEASALQADDQTLRRQRRFRDYGSDDLALQAELNGKLNTGTIQHDLLIGTETYRFKLDQRMLRVNPTNTAPYAIDIFNPQYGQAQPTPVANTNTREEQRNTAFYLQDTLTLSANWRAIAGLRFDNYSQVLDNQLTNVRTLQNPSVISPRLGLSYLPNAAWTIYANSARSFRPNNGVDNAGNGFSPESARAMELGTKWERADKRLGVTVALFDIRKSNMLTSDPVNTGKSIAAGEVSSRGIETDIAGQLSNKWRLNGSLTYNDVRVEKDNTLAVGSQLLNTPRVNGSVLAVYESGTASGNRYGLGGGMTHMGKRLGQTATPAFELPAYTTVKATAFLRVNKTVRLSLDIDNVLNAKYYTSSYSTVWVTPGTPRNLTVGLQAKF